MARLYRDAALCNQWTKLEIDLSDQLMDCKYYIVTHINVMGTSPKKVNP